MVLEPAWAVDIQKKRRVAGKERTKMIRTEHIKEQLWEDVIACFSYNMHMHMIIPGQSIH